ncbi:MAG: lmo0937 family membrane protein [Clostridiales bacterium]|nr:lmo0937 family membrane protein [Clostridiales bacterium]
MLLTIAIILGVLWLLGLLTATTFGGLIHILIVVAVIIVLINLFRGKRPVV